MFNGYSEEVESLYSNLDLKLTFKKIDSITNNSSTRLDYISCC